MDGCLMGTKVKVLRVVKGNAFVAARLFNSLTDVCLPVKHIDPGYVMTKDRRFIITDPKLKYIDDAMVQLSTLDAYKLRVSPEHDFAIIPNYFWFSGRNNSEFVKHRMQLPVFGVWRILTVHVAILPTLMITKEKLNKVNKLGMSIKEFKEAFKVKKFKKKFFWPNVYRSPMGGFTPTPFLDGIPMEKILANEWIEPFSKDELIPLSVEFKDISGCGKDGMLVVPLVYRPEYISDLLVAYDWGLFFDHLQYVLPDNVVKNGESVHSLQS